MAPQDINKSPKSETKYKNKTTEARACLMKVKAQVDKSRNLKSEIKEEILEAVKRLYAFAKEVEHAKKQERPIATPTAPQPSEQSTLAKRRSILNSSQKIAEEWKS